MSNITPQPTKKSTSTPSASRRNPPTVSLGSTISRPQQNTVAEVSRINSRLAVLEAGQRDMQRGLNQILDMLRSPNISNNNTTLNIREVQLNEDNVSDVSISLNTRQPQEGLTNARNTNSTKRKRGEEVAVHTGSTKKDKPADLIQSSRLIPVTSKTPPFNPEIDVLFGRGTPTNDNPGNVKFREFLFKNCYEEYLKEGTSKKRKTELKKEAFIKWKNETGGRVFDERKQNIVEGLIVFRKVSQMLIDMHTKSSRLKSNFKRNEEFHFFVPTPTCKPSDKPHDRKDPPPPPPPMGGGGDPIRA